MRVAAAKRAHGPAIEVVDFSGLGRGLARVLGLAPEEALAARVAASAQVDALRAARQARLGAEQPLREERELLGPVCGVDRMWREVGVTVVSSGGEAREQTGEPHARTQLRRAHQVCWQGRWQGHRLCLWRAVARGSVPRLWHGSLEQALRGACAGVDRLCLRVCFDWQCVCPKGMQLRL